MNQEKKRYWFKVKYTVNGVEKETTDCCCADSVGKARQILKRDFLGKRIRSSKVELEYTGQNEPI